MELRKVLGGQEQDWQAMRGLWTGDEGFDFLGMHHRKTKAETSQRKVYYTTQQWLTKKAEERIREVVKERLASPSMRSKSFMEQVE